MAVLVTRPHPDDETTAASLRARRFEVLRAPMLRFEPVAIHEDMNARYSAVIVTSANALRSIESHLKGHRMLELPLFAVGEHTAAAARRARYVMPSSPTRSRRCCTIRSAARAHSSMRRGPPASKYRHWRSRNAASPPR